jgi:addiction module HigA family antidote
MVEIPVDHMPPIHPGEIIREDILNELGLSVHAFSLALQVPYSRMADIVAGRRGISADTALRLARYLGSTPEFWLRLQADYDLKVAQAAGADIMHRIVPRDFTTPSTIHS